ncbi:hypothetical protein NIES2109_35440 [Nostoc sp. HK-01]|nr:hypothetical protein NIES2109_35440 [Nostoc sp. HK-01]
MPKKIRELKRLLLQAGFTYKPTKGSHSKWIHPLLPQAIIIAGKDGSDAKRMSENFLMLYLRLLDPPKSPLKRGTLRLFPPF